jgi:hypothetical protein
LPPSGDVLLLGMKWNMFSNEIANERLLIRNYGGISKTNNRVPTTNYKQQALREYAARLELEDELKEKDERLGLIMDIFDGISPEQLAAFSGATVETCKKFLNKE